MIPDETVHKILDTARIEEVLGDYMQLRKRGADLWACCPFHNEKTPSFHVEPAKGRYYCFGCHKGGSAVGFLMDYCHMTYAEALRELARKYGIEVTEEDETAEDVARRQRRESLLLVSEYASRFFSEQLSTPEGRSLGLAYFHSRGLEDETIAKYGLGWAPSGRRTFCETARKAGYKEEFLLETGLCAEAESDHSLRDRFQERVVFPIHSISGRIIGFGARTLKSKEDGKPYAKYINSKESEIYVKNKSLYGLYFARTEIARKDKCYLVEGYLDVLSMHQLGILNVVASSGTALTEGQISLIKRFSENVTIMYDGDSAGIHAAIRGIDMFLRAGMNVKVVLFPDGDDPDSYSRKHTLEEVQAFLDDEEKDFVDFKASFLLQGTEKDPLARANAINEIADTIALIPDATKRQTYAAFLAEKLQIRSDVLDSRVSTTRKKLLETEARNAEREKRGSLAPDMDPGEESPASDTRREPVKVRMGLEALENDPIMGKAERDLLGFILMDGTSKLKFNDMSEFFVSNEEEGQDSVFDFIARSIEDDGTEFSNVVYKQVYDLYSDLYYEGYGQDEIVKRLMDGEDRNVAYVAAELSNGDKYNLTVSNLRKSMTARETWLVRYVPRGILVFQKCRLEKRIAALTDRLRNASGEETESILADMVKERAVLKAVKIRLGREKAL